MAGAWRFTNLAISKYAAGREKDADFTAALVRHRMVDRQTLEQRLAATALDADARTRVELRLRYDFANA